MTPRFQFPPPRVQYVDVLYLDFDGVLHPQDVWQLVPGGPPYIRTPAVGHTLFEHMLPLQVLLEPYPDLRIVLSTTWVRHHGYVGSADFLCPALRKRCVGATWHQGMGRHAFNDLTRGEQVLEDVARRRPRRWLAIDDDTDGWGQFAQSHLVATHAVNGLAETNVFLRLDEALKRFAAP